MTELVRSSIGGGPRQPARRSLDERLFVRWPRLYRGLARAVAHLPPRSRLRRALLRRAVVSGWSAWSRGDLELMLVRYAPDFHLEPPAALMAAGMPRSYSGHEGVRSAAADLLEAWGRMEYVPVEVVDAGDPVLILGRLHLRGRESGVELDSEVAGVYWAHRGQVVRELQFTDWGEALRVAGVPEDHA